MTPPTDYEHMSTVYDEGRDLPLEWLDGWRVALDSYVDAKEAPILDLGAGTGLFSAALATWFDSEVAAIEPSEGMRREAALKSFPHVLIAGGKAEHIPLKGNTCSCAWLSTVIHHIPDLAACARQLRRVVREGGPVLIRNSFGDRLDGIHWLDYFPAAREVAAGRWPTIAAVGEAFAEAGYQVEAVRRVPETVARDLGAYYERIRVRANSTLTLITDDEFEEGLERLQVDARRQKIPEAVVDRRDLLILR